MPSTSEMSFGVRLLRAKTLHSYLSQFLGYAPPRPQEEIVNFGGFLDDIVAMNATGSGQQQNYNAAVMARYSAFREDTYCIFKLLAPIRAAVEAQYGKNSVEFKQTDSIVKNIRNSKLIKKPATETTPEITVSQSEQSYGSTTQYFNDLINTIAQYATYNPTNAKIQVGTLQTFATQINDLNLQVANTYQAIRATRHKRRDLYTELTNRTLRIKAYVKAMYGTQSEEYTLIKGLRI